jgi:hypothetical protein
MSRYRLRTLLILLALAILVVSAGAYVGGYFLLSNAVEIVVVREWRSRYFASEWQVRIFQPAAKVESLFCGKDVRLSAPRMPAVPLSTAPSTPSTRPPANNRP